MTATGVPRTARQFNAGNDANGLRMKGKASDSPAVRRSSLGYLFVQRDFGIRHRDGTMRGSRPARLSPPSVCSEAGQDD